MIFWAWYSGPDILGFNRHAKEPVLSLPEPTHDDSSSERKFLHDLANHIAISLGLLDLFMDASKPGTVLTESQLTRLGKANSHLEKIRLLVVARKAVVNSEGSEI